MYSDDCLQTNLTSTIPDIADERFETVETLDSVFIHPCCCERTLLPGRLYSVSEMLAFRTSACKCKVLASRSVLVSEIIEYMPDVRFYLCQRLRFVPVQQGKI